MDSKTETASEAKERIEKEATNHGLRVMEYTKDFHDGINTKDAYITGATAEHNRAQEEITRLKAELERQREKVLYEASEYFQEFGDRERFTSLQVQQVLMSLIKKSKN